MADKALIDRIEMEIIHMEGKIIIVPQRIRENALLSKVRLLSIDEGFAGVLAAAAQPGEFKQYLPP